jgi:hypothetical protein
MISNLRTSDCTISSERAGGGEGEVIRRSCTDISWANEAEAMPQPRTMAAIRPSPKPIIRHGNSYAELHSVMSEIRASEKRAKK